MAESKANQPKRKQREQISTSDHHGPGKCPTPSRQTQLKIFFSYSSFDVTSPLPRGKNSNWSHTQEKHHKRLWKNCFPKEVWRSSRVSCRHGGGAETLFGKSVLILCQNCSHFIGREGEVCVLHTEQQTQCCTGSLSISTAMLFFSRSEETS